jgi:hypothetical protein
VAHACNPNYSGGRDQEDRSSKPAKTNTSGDPILKKIFHKKGLVEWLKVKAEFKLKYCKEKHRDTNRGSETHRDPAWLPHVATGWRQRAALRSALPVARTPSLQLRVPHRRCALEEALEVQAGKMGASARLRVSEARKAKVQGPACASAVQVWVGACRCVCPGCPCLWPSLLCVPGRGCTSVPLAVCTSSCIWGGGLCNSPPLHPSIFTPLRSCSAQTAPRS